MTIHIILMEYKDKCDYFASFSKNLEFKLKKKVLGVIHGFENLNL